MKLPIIRECHCAACQEFDQMSVASKSVDRLMEENARLINVLRTIESAPTTMANDSESLRHTIKVIQQEARAAISSGDRE